MIDTRAVAQEVQDQLVAAMHRGHEQLRKSQEQVRKGREAVTVAIRTGNHLAQAVKPNLPAVHVPSLSELASREKLRANAHELAGQVVTTQRKLAGNAQELAGQVFATQRKLAGKAVEVASPLLVDGVARLTHVAGTFAPGRRNHQADQVEQLAPATTAGAATATKPSEAAAEPEPTVARTPEAAAAPASARPATARVTKAKPAADKPAADKPAKAKTASTPAKPRAAKK